MRGIGVRAWKPLAFLLLLGGLPACSGGGGPSGATPGEPGPVDPPLERPWAYLDRALGCDDLREALRNDARVKIGVQADSLRAGAWQDDEIGNFDPLPVPAAPGPDSGGSRGPEDFTDTNVQETGVDEADFVETDGERIYLLHAGQLVVVDSWPPEGSALEASLPIEGQPRAMFVALGRAAVFSDVYDAGGALRVRGDCLGIGPPVPSIEPAIAIDEGICAPAFTKLTLVDLEAGPRVVREIYLEGTYTAARRHDAIVRLVVQGGFGVPPEVPDFWSELYSGPLPASEEEFLERVDAWEAMALEAIASSDLDDWLPGQWERRAGVLEELPPLCTAVHLPAAGASGHGMTRVLGLDMGLDEGPTYDTLVLGYARDVYASPERLVLAQPEWNPDESGDRTALHLFAIGPGNVESRYLGSGSVPGIPLNQFAFDMDDEILRVAATQTGWNSGGSDVTTRSRIVTLRLEGNTLTQLGETEGLAPGERIYAVRFRGDRGYLVTFRQIDPLFVVDLSDPTRPTVLGELELPGFSEYMQPLGGDHLLTIGQEADLQGRVQGLALRIFDVSEDTRPILAHAYFFSGNGWSAANSDHRAFTFDPRRGLLTFPYVSYQEDFRSTLELFAVDVETGFTLLGEVEHTSFVAEACGAIDDWRCPYTPEIRRGLFIEDFLYSVSAAGIQAHAVDDLETVLAQISLPLPGGQP